MEHKPQKATIEFSILETIDIRMCRVESAEPVLKNPKKDPSEDNPIKAYKLLIDTGLDKRECITNLVNWGPTLVGKCLPFVLNLPVANIRGVESRAMIVAACGTTIEMLEPTAASPGDVVL